ncbi:MAG: rane dipeptidase [Actinomycetota bacterium]|jgi:membrane dipeptidase|nr:rane dipeptidase [Actinomycetota bacterium]
MPAVPTSDDRILTLLREAPLIDGHNDLAWALRETFERDGTVPDIATDLPERHTDIPRMARGGVGGQFWSVYVPSHLPEAEAAARTLEQIDRVHGFVDANSDRLELARTANDVERIAASGRVASMIGVEGGHAIRSSLGVLRVLATLGAGYLTLTHNDDTPWADSATGDQPHGGLTRFGEEVIRELNRLGILVDLSHVSDDVMRQAIELSEAPVIFSHSSARALCDVPRNVPDDVLELAGRTDAVVMVTFVPSFLTVDGAKINAEGWEEARRLRAEMPDDPAAVDAAMEAWFVEHPDPPASVTDVADHIDHVRQVAGVDHIGVGSDFDGAPAMPDGLSDAAGYPVLFAALADRGYTDDDLSKIAGRNVLRVMRANERTAERLRSEREPSRARIEDLDGV